MGLLDFLGLGGKSSQSFAPDTKPDNVIKKISVETAHKLSANLEVVLIDVRMPQEWSDTGRPVHAQGITLQDPAFEEKLASLVNGDKSRALAFSCKTGGRSSQAAEKADMAGYTDIANVEGGFLAWQAAGLPIDQGPFD